MRAGQRIGRVSRAGIRHAERGEQRVADELLETPRVPEDLLLHAPVERPEQRHHLLGRHLLGERGEADEVGEEDADRLPAHATQRLVARGEHVDHARREVARQIAPRALRLRALPAPALIIAGEDDKDALEPCQQLVELLPRAELVVIPRAGHVVNLAQPAEFNARARAFLDAL